MAPIVVEMVPGIVDGDLNQMIDDLSSNTSARKSVLVCHTIELVVDIALQRLFLPKFLLILPRLYGNSSLNLPKTCRGTTFALL